MKTHHWPTKNFVTIKSDPLNLLRYNPRRAKLPGETKKEYQEYLKMMDEYDSKSQ